jgi:hypothetical protein
MMDVREVVKVKLGIDLDSFRACSVAERDAIYRQNGIEVRATHRRGRFVDRSGLGGASLSNKYASEFVVGNNTAYDEAVLFEHRNVGWDKETTDMDIWFIDPQVVARRNASLRKPAY